MMNSKEEQPRCKRCGKPLRDPVSIAAGFGPTCRGAVEKGRRMAYRGNAPSHRGGMSMPIRSPSTATVEIMPLLWRVYDIPNGEIEQVIAMHKARFGSTGIALLSLDVPGEVYIRAKRMVAIVIKNGKVMPGQVWLF